MMTNDDDGGGGGGGKLEALWQRKPPPRHQKLKLTLFSDSFARAWILHLMDC